MTRSIRFITVAAILFCLCGCLPESSSTRPTQTKIPNLISNDPLNPISSNPDTAFHINFNMDESVTCTAGVECDSAYIPKISIYFRGDVEKNNKGELSGIGRIIVTNSEPCQTLHPDNSSCIVTGVTDGLFNITGQMEGSQMALTLQVTQMPSLQVSYTVKHPAGDVIQDLTPTYTEEFSKLFENAGIVAKEFTFAPIISTTTSAIDFEGTYTFGSTRKLHGFGGLIVINPDTPLPQPYLP